MRQALSGRVRPFVPPVLPPQAWRAPPLMLGTNESYGTPAPKDFTDFALSSFYADSRSGYATSL